MKQFIVLGAMIALGIVIYNVIAGPGDDTIVSALGEVWKESVAIRSYAP